jgi:acyl carrier protein
MNAAASEYGYSTGPAEYRRSGSTHGSVGEPLADNSSQGSGEVVSESGSATTSDPASTANVPVAQVIRSAAAATLGIAAESIGPDVDFTALGLSSLLAIELRRALEVRLGIRIATAELFQHPTVTMLADALTTRLPEDPGESR